MGIVGAHNVGKVLELKLEEVGITSLDQLRKVGTEAAFMLLYEKNKNTSRAILLSIEGAIQEVRWHNLDEKRVEELKEFFDSVVPKRK
ncbi:MAG: competence protein TfoX [Bacteroidales bacterium]|jgi:DNA transformation protein|nr:TfoX/Sxy family protein [Bacteroidales bacterium]MCK9499290.1 TfoX/Sxy family protein [Bacteroidales bacterium]MDY0313667.1 TfoX/Sxy family DNA transformation protein [Bacteroidales bacterium]NLB85936.1 competence protein TfoX [Bacteroidales bacterium]